MAALEIVHEGGSVLGLATGSDLHVLVKVPVIL
jgi:hypothetical protein